MIDGRAEKTERIRNNIDFIKIFAETVVWPEYSRVKAPDLSLVHSGISWKRSNHELYPLLLVTSGEKELSNQGGCAILLIILDGEISGKALLKSIGLHTG
ncbi:hypothetical protein TNIN_75761 [Trichonephila inaurata madagascariensis]|uniref:Uncharacterized protein n=1 Tax=Trichonephila inaurata madagascariensis TaxID=2747483 RepID=A0A8X6XR74_9ARAC|nr:hypothetical protein TNIN_75761 [Trichonephila inaurata madagascariensis]